MSKAFTSNKLYKVIYILLGTVSLIIGILGIIVPGLPTTPFLLITAALYLRSSDRLYKKLIETRFIGSYIREYREKKGMTLKEKIRSITLMWIMIAISCTYFIEKATVIIIVLIAGLIGTIVMGFIVKTAKD